MQEANNNEALEREQVWMLALISCLEDGKTVQRGACDYKFYPSIKMALRDSMRAEKHTDLILRSLGWHLTDPSYH